MGVENGTCPLTKPTVCLSWNSMGRHRHRYPRRLPREDTRAEVVPRRGRRRVRRLLRSACYEPDTHDNPRRLVRRLDRHVRGALFLARILARLSIMDARVHTCKRVLYTISYRVHVYKITSVSVSVLWNLSISHDVCSQHGVTALSRLVTASRDKLDRPKLKRVSPSRR